MTDDPIHWHYGLMAERWAEFTPAAPEAAFFQREIARFGQPALDLGCGVGRLLLPLLQAGIDIDGCDISGDMLRYCRTRAAGLGFQPRLYQQPMHAFDLPRTYRTIFICAAFNLAGSREKALATLQHCHAHLEDGGALLFNITAEYACPGEWEKWEPANRKILPEPWPEEGRRRVAADGSEYVERFRLVSLNPLEQRDIRQVRLEKWVSGGLAAREEYELQGDLYLPNEVRLMLQVAGFRQVALRGDFTDTPATPDSQELIFTAVR